MGKRLANSPQNTSGLAKGGETRHTNVRSYHNEFKSRSVETHN